MNDLKGRCYFAYGSNMDVEQMRIRCPASRVLGTARLGGYRFRINRRGVATVVAEAGAVAWGVVWDLTREDEQTLDGYEGVPAGFYSKEVVRVDALSCLGLSEGIRALTYVAADSRPGVARAGYLGRIIEAALHHGLPQEYAEELCRWTGE
jgi:hypothetical protein